jgi:hypothetical protein
MWPTRHPKSAMNLGGEKGISCVSPEASADQSDFPAQAASSFYSASDNDSCCRGEVASPRAWRPHPHQPETSPGHLCLLATSPLAPTSGWGTSSSSTRQEYARARRCVSPVGDQGFLETPPFQLPVSSSQPSRTPTTCVVADPRPRSPRASPPGAVVRVGPSPRRSSHAAPRDQAARAMTD